MSKILATFIPIPSLVISLLAIRGYLACDHLRIVFATTEWWVDNSRGTMLLQCMKTDPIPGEVHWESSDPYNLEGAFQSIDYFYKPRRIALLGDRLIAFRWPTGHKEYALWLPMWQPLVFSLSLPVWWLHREVRERRNRRNSATQICVGCGYDLRATPERCPECGKTAARSPPLVVKET